MTMTQANQLPPVPQRDQAPLQDSKLKFDRNSEFHLELRRRVDQFFESTGRRKRDCPQMYVKSIILLLSLVTLYIGLVYFAQTAWQAVILAILLGFVMAGVGFNIQHDGGHQGYSDYAWVNKLMAMSLELMGGSSYIWRWKHGVFHHTYVNVTHHDTDVDIGIFGRLTPHQPWFSFHRWQHFYLWPLYGFVAIRWQLLDDFRDFFTGKIGGRSYPRPKGGDLAVFWGGKLLFLTLAFVIPLMRHSAWHVLAIYGVVAVVLGVLLSIVFQLAHVVGEADFPLPQDETGQMGKDWAQHQVETTVNFARSNRPLSWFLGGLNFQIEHHLFPQISHVHYPAIAPIVQEVCQEFGVRYVDHSSFWTGIVSHFHWLRRMGTVH